MALPTPIKTWRYDVNRAIPATGTALTTDQNLAFDIKNSMVGNSATYTDNTGVALGGGLDAAAKWSVRYSSNSTTASAADNWSTSSDLIWAADGSPHSYIVLRQTNIGSTFDICIDLDSGASSQMTVTAAPGGYQTSVSGANGTTTNRPLPVRTGGEIALSGGVNNWANGSDASYRQHFLYSSDGQAFLYVLYFATLPVTMFLFQKIQNPVSGWTTPGVGMTLMSSGSTNVITPTNLYFTANLKGFVNAGINSAIAVNSYLSAEGYNDVLLSSDQVSANDLDNTFPLLPVGVTSKSPSARGRHGTLFDTYYGLDVNGQASTYPNSTARTWVQFGSLVVPWNTTTPVIA